MALDHYFKKKAVLTDPNDLSSTIHPMLIASMHREVEVTQGATYIVQIQVLH